MSTSINEVAMLNKQEMSSRFNQIENKILTRNKNSLYLGLALGFGVSIIIILAMAVLPSIIYSSLPSIGAIWSYNLAGLVSIFLALLLILILGNYFGKRMPEVSPIQKLFYYCYKIDNKLKEYLQDEDPFHLNEAAKSLKYIYMLLIGGRVHIEDIPILRHNSEYNEFLKLKSLFRKKVLHSLSSKTKIKDIKSLEFVFRYLSRFFYNDEESSWISIAIAKLKDLEDRPLKVFGVDFSVVLIKKGLYSDNRFVKVFVTFFIILIVMLVISGFICIIASLFGTPISNLIPVMISVSFGGAALLTVPIITYK